MYSRSDERFVEQWREKLKEWKRQISSSSLSDDAKQELNNERKKIKKSLLTYNISKFLETQNKMQSLHNKIYSRCKSTLFSCTHTNVETTKDPVPTRTLKSN